MNYLASNANTFAACNQWSSSVWASTSQSPSSPSSDVIWNWPTSNNFHDAQKSDGQSSISSRSSSHLTSPQLSPTFEGDLSFNVSPTFNDFTHRTTRPTSAIAAAAVATPPTSTTTASATGTYDDSFGEMTFSKQTLPTSFAFDKRPLNRQEREYTETVAVDSSACVAQIVGKNGCKIKLLRAKYGIYIHTPVAGEEPVFIIKGRRENVNRVKQEILNTGQHFNQLRANKAAKIEGIINAAGSLCMKVHIPDRFVGLVVGRNGWFVKVLQARFNVHVETPKFDIRTYFLIYGLEMNVKEAIWVIIEHISNKNNRMMLNCRQVGNECFIE